MSCWALRTARMRESLLYLSPRQQGIWDAPVGSACAGRQDSTSAASPLLACAAALLILVAPATPKQNTYIYCRADFSNAGMLRRQHVMYRHVFANVLLGIAHCKNA